MQYGQPFSHSHCRARLAPNSRMSRQRSKAFFTMPCASGPVSTRNILEALGVSDQVIGAHRETEPGSYPEHLFHCRRYRTANDALVTFR